MLFRAMVTRDGRRGEIHAVNSVFKSHNFLCMCCEILLKLLMIAGEGQR